LKFFSRQKGAARPFCPGTRLPAGVVLALVGKRKAHVISQEFRPFGLGKKKWRPLKNSRTAAGTYVSIQAIQEAIKPS
jgi:hypothetical protein